MVEEAQTQPEGEMTDEEAILKIAAAMKDNAPLTEDKQNVHTFLLNVVNEENVKKISKIGNLRDDKELNELGVPIWHVRGSLGMALISDKIMDNSFFKEYFEADSEITLDTSLSREGFLIKMATTNTKQVVDATRRRKTNRGMFGKKTEETSGGDINSPQYNQNG